VKTMEKTMGKPWENQETSGFVDFCWRSCSKIRVRRVKNGSDMTKSGEFHPIRMDMFELRTTTKSVLTGFSVLLCDDV